jgi:hypothetical protein
LHPARLRCAEGNPSVLDALCAAHSGEVIQMSEGLRQREAPLIERESVAEDDPGDGEGGLRFVAKSTVHEIETLLMVQEEFVDAPVEVV